MSASVMNYIVMDYIRTFACFAASTSCNRLQPNARQTDTSAMFVTPIRMAAEVGPRLPVPCGMGINLTRNARRR